MNELARPDWSIERGEAGVAPGAAAGVEGVAVEIEEPEGFAAGLGEAAGAVEGGGGAADEMGVGAVVVAVQQHEVVASAQQPEQGARIAQAVEEAGFVEGIVGHQEDVAAGGDFGAVEEAAEGVEFEGGDASAGVPEGEVGAGGVEGDGDGVVAHPADEGIAGGGGGFGEVAADEGGEVLAVEGEGGAGIEVVVAGDGEGAAAGEGEDLGEARGGGGEFALEAEVERVAGVEEVVDGFAAEEVAQAVELLEGVGVFGAAAEIEVDEGDEALGVEDFGRAEGAGRERQMDVAEMEDAETHAGDRSGRRFSGKAGNTTSGTPAGFRL